MAVGTPQSDRLETVALDSVDEEALVAAIAAQDAVRDQVMVIGCVRPFALIWMTRDGDGASLASPSITIIRAENEQEAREPRQARSEAALSQRHLVLKTTPGAS